VSKYDEQFKRTVVNAYLSGGPGFKALAAKFDVDHATIRKWVHGYRMHGDAALRKKSAHYSAQFKLSVLQQMWKEELSHRQALVLFDIRGGVAVINEWERQYHEDGLQGLERKPRACPKPMYTPPPPQKQTGSKPADESRSREDLLKEIGYLRTEVAYLKKLDALVRTQQQTVPKKCKP
jgi:transposase